MDIRVVSDDGKTLKEQIQTYLDASILVLGHGAGMVHTMWMKPHSKVLEIIPEDKTKQKDGAVQGLLRLTKIFHFQLERIMVPTSTCALEEYDTQTVHDFVTSSWNISTNYRVVQSQGGKCTVFCRSNATTLKPLSDTFHLLQDSSGQPSQSDKLWERRRSDSRKKLQVWERGRSHSHNKLQVSESDGQRERGRSHSHNKLQVSNSDKPWVRGQQPSTTHNRLYGGQRSVSHNKSQRNFSSARSRSSNSQTHTQKKATKY